MEENLNLLKELIEEITETSIEYLDSEGNLVDDYNIDSMSMIQLVITIEERFNIEVPYEYLDMKILSDISKLVKLIETLPSLREDK